MLHFHLTERFACRARKFQYKVELRIFVFAAKWFEELKYSIEHQFLGGLL